jgi:hypothetical protein
MGSVASFQKGVICDHLWVSMIPVLALLAAIWMLYTANNRAKECLDNCGDKCAYYSPNSKAVLDAKLDSWQNTWIPAIAILAGVFTAWWLVFLISYLYTRFSGSSSSPSTTSWDPNQN